MSQEELGVFEVTLPEGTSFTIAIKDKEIRIRKTGWHSIAVQALPNQELTRVLISRDSNYILDRPIEEKRVSNREAFERLVGIFCKRG